MSGSAEAENPHHGSLGFNLGAIMLALALLAVGVAYAIDATSRAAHRQGHRLDEATALTRTLGGRDLEIPLAWFRYEEQRVEGFAKQIDLRLDLPLGDRGALATIDVTLLPRSRARPSAALLDGVYLHQFEDTQLDGPRGLIGKPLKPSAGYENETVWYDALSASPFVAKCSKPIATTAAAQCLRTVYLGTGIAAIYAFPDSVLSNWREFDTLLLERMGGIGAL